MTATVDIKTRKIIGSKTPSEYNHESAHLDFADSELGSTIQYLDEIIWRADIIFIVLCLIGISIFKWFALLGIFINLGFFIFEELWCNFHATTDKKTGM